MSPRYWRWLTLRAGLGVLVVGEAAGEVDQWEYLEIRSVDYGVGGITGPHSCDLELQEGGSR